MAGNRPRRLTNFRDWEIRLSRKSAGIVEKFSKFYTSKTGGDFVAKVLGFVVTVRPMLWDRCPVCRVLLFVCDIVVLSPNGWMDQDATWYGGRHPSRPHYVRWGSSFPYRKRHSSGAPTFRSMAMSIVVKRSTVSATAKLASIGVGPQISAWRGQRQNHVSWIHAAVWSK